MKKRLYSMLGMATGTGAKTKSSSHQNIAPTNGDSNGDSSVNTCLVPTENIDESAMENNTNGDFSVKTGHQDVVPCENIDQSAMEIDINGDVSVKTCHQNVAPTENIDQSTKENETNVSIVTEQNAPAPASTVQLENNEDEVMQVAVGIDSEAKLSDDQLPNESVNVDKDILTKFIEENPDPSYVKGKENGKLPPFSPLSQQTVATVAAPDLDKQDRIFAHQMFNTQLKIEKEERIRNINGPTPANANLHNASQVAARADRPANANLHNASQVAARADRHANANLQNASQVAARADRQVRNRAGGDAYKVCDMNRLRRYIVLGTEHNTYYSTPGQSSNLDKTMQSTLDNIKCVKNLLDQGRHEEVVKTITEYSLAGRVAKEEPILSILAMCATHENVDIQKTAYSSLVEICSIPTKLFKFLDLTQEKMYQLRAKNPPSPQKNISKRKRNLDMVTNIQNLNVNGDNPNSVSTEPSKKRFKKARPELKKVNKAPKKSSGWGRMRRKAVSRFYEDKEKNSCRLLYLLTKYKHRHNWSHKEVIAFCHPKMTGDIKFEKDLAIEYCIKGYEKVKPKLENTYAGMGEERNEVISYINVLDKVSKLSPSKAGDEEELIDLLNTFGKRNPRLDKTTYSTNLNIEDKKSAVHIVREHIPTGFLKSPKVWEVLLIDMPMTALIRNLGKMSAMGLFKDEDNVTCVVDSLTNVEKLKAARIHPMKILIAMKVYEEGKGDKSDAEWPVNKDIVKALDAAFYLSFKQPEVKDNYKTGHNYMLCLDVSGSMNFHGCVGCNLIKPSMASVAMAWVTWNVEDNVELVAFGGHLVNMKDPKWGFHKGMTILEAMKKTREINFGSTDCSLPMIHALEKKMEVDVFIVYTDNDTRAGKMRPAAALRRYNQDMNRSAKLIVCGMETTGFTIADPQDPNMMDIVGFDDNVPELISEFAKGNLSGACGAICPECSHEAPSN